MFFLALQFKMESDCTVQGLKKLSHVQDDILKQNPKENNLSSELSSGFFSLTDAVHSISGRVTSWSNFSDPTELPLPPASLAAFGLMFLLDSVICCGCQFKESVQNFISSPERFSAEHKKKSPTCNFAQRMPKLETKSKPRIDDAGPTAAANENQIRSDSSQLEARNVTRSRDTALQQPSTTNASPIEANKSTLLARQTDSNTRGNFVKNVKTKIPPVPKPVPLYAEYGSYEQRINTYHNFPTSCPMEPTDLARAGFYYVNDRDKTKCAYCNGAIYNWDPTDTAFGEHIRHFPRCEWPKYYVYQTFSTEIPLKCVRPPLPEHYSKEKLAAKAAINIGYPDTLVYRVIDSFKQTNRDVSATNILEALFEKEVKEKRCLLEELPGEVIEEADSNRLYERLRRQPNRRQIRMREEDDLYESNSDSGNDSEV